MKERPLLGWVFGTKNNSTKFFITDEGLKVVCEDYRDGTENFLVSWDDLEMALRQRPLRREAPGLNPQPKKSNKKNRSR